MFPFNQDDELFFQNSSIPHQEDIIQQDQVQQDSTSGCSKKGKGPRPQKLIVGDNDEDDDKKKMLHRDIERQRRQEMTARYASLRSLLPLEYVKGKRSISDHMNEAVNYIKHMENKIKEMSIKRDELKSLKDSTKFGEDGESSNKCWQNCVTICQCHRGFEIVCCSGFKEQSLPLSRVLEILLNEGLNVVSCVSSKVNEGLFHTIQTEVNESTSIDISGLQERLNEVIQSQTIIF